MISTKGIEICNIALAKLGVPQIESINDNNMQSLTVKSLYPMIKDAVLSSYTWSFATKNATLSKNNQQGNKIFYSLPSDFLRAITAFQSNENNPAHYDIQGNHIVSKSENITLQYIARRDETDFPAYFLQALIARLAADFCLPLIDSTSRSESLYKIAEIELQKARGLDNQQLPPQSLSSNILLGGRG